MSHHHRQRRYTPGAAEAHRSNHAAWVAAGHCPSVDRSKSWCRWAPGHDGDHFCPYAPFSAPESAVGSYWTDDQADDCPCDVAGPPAPPPRGMDVQLVGSPTYRPEAHLSWRPANVPVRTRNPQDLRDMADQLIHAADDLAAAQRDWQPVELFPTEVEHHR